LRQFLLRGKTIFQPDPATVQSYHAPGGYLDRMEIAFGELRNN